MKPRFTLERIHLEVALFGVISLLLMWGPVPSEQNHYCSINRDHTLCKFAGVGPKCHTPMELGIPSRDRQHILQLHNTLRLTVASGAERRGRGGGQPSASNMRQMEWDDELAQSAQRLAEQCKYTHDCLNCRKVDRFLTGQNLYQFSENILRDGSDWDQAIMAWYDEVAEWSPRNTDRFEFIKKLGHFTQMVWADTYKIGCGYVYYNEGKWNRKLYVCNYGPAGNIITTQMYKRGAPCSECPEGTSCSNQYPGLCSGGGRGGPSYAPPAPPPPPAHVTQRPTAPPTTRRTTTTTTTAPPTTRRTTTTTTTAPPTTRRTTTTTTTTPRPTTQRTTTTTTTTPRPTTTYRTTFPTTPRTQRTFPTTTQKPSTTHHSSKIIFNELESNEITGDHFTSTNKLDLSSRFTFPQKNNRNSFFSQKTSTQRPKEIRNRFQQNTTPRLTFSRFVTTKKPSTTTTKLPNKYHSNYYNHQNQYYQTSTKKPFTFSPRVYPEEQKQNNRIKNSIDSFPTRRAGGNNNNRGNNFNFEKSGKPESKVVKLQKAPELSVEDINSILLFCDFDFAKCPVRSMRNSGWNYTAFETPGFGHGFASIVGPGSDSHLQIRSDVFPTDSNGMVCVHFRFVYYPFNVDGRDSQTNGIDPKTRLPAKFTVTAEPSSPSETNTNSLVEFTDKSKFAYDWLTGRIQFKDLNSQFLLNFQVPTNNLVNDNIYLAVDDILVTQGKCHT